MTIAHKATAFLLQGGLVIDGSNQPGYVGDVLLAGSRIVAVGACNSIAGSTLDKYQLTVMDCQNKVIAPGFVDVHTHDDAAVLDSPDMLPKLSQGVTTVVVGNCGISLVPMQTSSPVAPLSLLGSKQFRFKSVAAYGEAIDSVQPGVNVAVLLGHTTLRIGHMADLNVPARGLELEAMVKTVNAAMQDGAIGLSSGVFYKEAYAADITELTALACAAAQNGGVYATHIRDEMAAILPALQEAALTAKQSGLALILSHHKCAGPANWGRTKETLPFIEKLAIEQEISLDVYPYTAGSTVLREDLVDGVIDVLITGSQPHPEMGGRYLADIASEWGCTQKQACRRLMPGGACYFQMNEADVERVITHPLSMIGSDGLPHDERPHPRLWGTFPRVLARYWRDRGVLALEQAIYKMSGMSAERFRLPERGRLCAGHFADIVVFDPQHVRDLAAFDQPKQFSEGIEQVWVNGVLSYTGTERGTGVRAGRFLRRALRAT
jgi:N-acyl-D-amino-acid deacylase